MPVWTSLPFGLREVDDARLVRPDWVITRPLLAGVCGSESKLVLGDFDTGDIDNPMAAFSSIPHIPGHEVVAEVVALGPDASGLEVGQRVLLNPWLTCGPRGIDAAVPGVPERRPQPVLEFHFRRPGARASTSGWPPTPRGAGPTSWPPTTRC